MVAAGQGRSFAGITGCWAGARPTRGGHRPPAQPSNRGPASWAPPLADLAASCQRAGHISPARHAEARDGCMARHCSGQAHMEGRLGVGLGLCGGLQALSPAGLEAPAHAPVMLPAVTGPLAVRLVTASASSDTKPRLKMAGPRNFSRASAPPRVVAPYTVSGPVTAAGTAQHTTAQRG